MDIKKWLDGTTLPNEDAVALAHASGADQRHMRKMSSDSSLIQPAANDLADRTKAKRKRSTSESSSVSSDDASTRSVTTNRDEGSSEGRYDRKPRRKTREERYMPKEARKERHALDGKNKVARRKKKTKRHKKGKAGVGLVQSFHAKNVPKDRLTLRPQENAGLFSKGKASSPVKGRGLPDLVFSEMRFLQKRKQSTEDKEQAEKDSRRQKKKGQARGNQNEISTYFTGNKRALEQGDPNVGLSFTDRSKILLSPSPIRNSRKVEAIRETIENSENMFLGFGSRGVKPPSNSYLPWSDSARLGSIPAPNRRRGCTIEAGHLDRTERQHGHDAPVHKTFEGRTVRGRQNEVPIRLDSRRSEAISSISRSRSEPIRKSHEASTIEMVVDNANTRDVDRPEPELSPRYKVGPEVMSATVYQRPYVEWAQGSERIKRAPQRVEPHHVDSDNKETRQYDTRQGTRDVRQRSSSLSRLLRACETAVLAGCDEQQQAGHVDDRAQKKEAVPDYSTGGGRLPDMYRFADSGTAAPSMHPTSRALQQLPGFLVVSPADQSVEAETLSQREGGWMSLGYAATGDVPVGPGDHDIKMQTLVDLEYDNMDLNDGTWLLDDDQGLGTNEPSVIGDEGSVHGLDMAGGESDVVFEGFRRPYRLY